MDAFLINYENLCRTCLVTLSEGAIKYNLCTIPELASKLAACTAHPVEAGDAFPKQLCTGCYQKLNVCYDFYTMCAKSLKHMKKWQQEHCQEFVDEKPEYDLEAQPEMKILVGTTDILLQNDTLNSNTSNQHLDNGTPEMPEEALHESFVMEVLEGGGKALCAMNDGETDVNVDMLNDDSSAEAAEETKTSAKPKKTCVKTRRSRRQKIRKANTNPAQEKAKNSKVFQCDMCPLHFVAKHSLKAHKIGHAGAPPYSCMQSGCNKTFNRRDGLSRHLKSHECTEQLYACKEVGCDKAYRHKPTLLMHMRKVHKLGRELKSHVCEICGKVFKASSVLNDHRYTHKAESELPHACDQPQCQRRFSNKEKLKVHLKRHAGIKNFVCPYCGLRKTTQNELKIHINYHTLERTWPCRFCSHVCNSAGNLKMHVRTVHERAKDYACRFCERSFAKKDTCKYHEMTHTGEKPNECSECGKRFTQPAALRTHKKIHRRHSQLNSKTIAVES